MISHFRTSLHAKMTFSCACFSKPLGCCLGTLAGDAGSALERSASSSLKLRTLESVYSSLSFSLLCSCGIAHEHVLTAVTTFQAVHLFQAFQAFQAPPTYPPFNKQAPPPEDHAAAHGRDY